MKTIITFIIFLLVTACAPSQEVIERAIKETQAAYTSTPSLTPTPKITLTPTYPKELIIFSTPNPPVELLPGERMLTCDDIVDVHNSVTDLQWDEYRRNVKGKPISYSGDIIEVNSDGSVQINGCKGLFNVCVIYGIPREIALTLDQDQYIFGEGTVREVDMFVGVHVDINAVSINK